MGRTLPGADKYRRPPEDRSAPWLDPLVEKANAEVRIEDVLNTYFKMHVPMEAEGWKTYCPFRYEHDDGGIDRQFRVYASTNSGHCFALHGTLDPVRLWRLRSYFPTIKDAAADLLRTFGVEYRTKPYWERMKALRERGGFTADADAVVQAFNVFAAAQPNYGLRQYDDDVLRDVNLTLSQVHGVCAEAESLEEVEAWLQAAKSRLLRVLGP